MIKNPKSKIQNPKLLIAASVIIGSCFFHSSTAQASTPFMDLVNSKGTTVPAEIKLDAGSYAIDGDFTIPINVTLQFTAGATITIPSGYTLKINGNIDDSSFKIFDDQNSDLTKGVKFNGGTFSKIRPEWWGATADDNPNSADQNSAAITKAANATSGSASETVFFSIGKYYISQAIAIRQGVSLAGQGDTHSYDNTSVIRLKDGSNVPMVTTAESGASTYHRVGDIANLRFHGGNQSAIVNGIDFNNIIINSMRIRNCGFTNFNGHAIRMVVNGRTMIESNWISDCMNGMYLQTYDGWIRNNTIAFTGAYGIRIIGFDTPFQGNKIDGGSTGVACLFGGGAAFANLTGNDFEHCDYGISDDPGASIGGMFYKNIIKNNRKNGIYSQRSLSRAHIADNTITGNGQYGIYMKGGTQETKIENNDLSGNASGAIYYSAGSTCSFEPQSCGEYPFIENNAGIDSSVSAYPQLESSSTPNVANSKYWRTNNSSSVSINNFTRSSRGKEIFVDFGDSNTTLKFNTNLGSDLATNGNFDTSGSWTFGQSWSWSDTDKAASHAKGDNSTALFPIEQNIGASAGALYEVTMTIKNCTSGAVTPIIASSWGYGGMNDRGSLSQNGTFTRVIKADTGTVLKIYPSYDFVGEIDDIAVKKIDTALRGFGGADKKFNSGEHARCLKGPDTYWYCDDTTGGKILESDLNSDGKVDAADLAILQTDFLKTTASLANPKSDIDGDGTATLKDMGILMSQWKP